MDLRVTDRVALVTGGSSGIGLATVECLLEEGANVVTCARNGERLDAALEPLNVRYPGRLVWGTADVRSRSDMESLVERGVDTFGGLHFAVGNAGQSMASSFATTSDDQWRSELDLKFFGTINTVHAALPHLKSAEDASIVFVNAVLARQPEPHLIATSAARAGLLNLSRSLSRELGEDSIRVNSVCVGVIDSGQWRRRYENSGSSATFEEWSKTIAKDRGTTLTRFGKSAEVAAAITFLLSSQSGYTTGSVLDIDGGVGRYV